MTIILGKIKAYLISIFSGKHDDRFRIPVYDDNKSDSLYYNNLNGCVNHNWFFYYDEIDLTETALSSIGVIRSSNRICETCFLWEFKILDTNTFWKFQGFGKEAFNKLTERKIKNLLEMTG